MTPRLSIIASAIRKIVSGTPQSTADPYWSNVVLCMRMEQVTDPNVWIDDTGKTVTVHGPIQYDTQSKYGSTCAFLSPYSYCYFTLDGSSDFALGTGDLTIETWIKFTNLNTNQNIFDFRPSGTQGVYPVLYIGFFNNTINYNVDGIEQISVSHGMTAGDWYHLAVVRKNGVTTIYRNGSSIGSFNDTFNYSVGASRPAIGTSGHTPSSFLDARLDEFRITKGVARYDGNFTPAQIPVDQYLQNVSLYLLMEGANGSTSFIDTAGKCLVSSIYGNPIISTTDKKSGLSSLYLEGNGSGIKVDHNDGLVMDGSDFTAEVWFNTSKTNGVVFNKSGVGNQSNANWSMGLSAQHLYFTIGNSSATPYSSLIQSVIGSLTYPLNTWNHAAIVKSGMTYKMYLNGVQDPTTYTAPSNPTDARADKLSIGYEPGQPASSSFLGYLDGLRITKGVARYTANFTPS